MWLRPTQTPDTTLENATFMAAAACNNFSNISEAGNSQLNNALLESFKGLSITTGNGLPKIDRESKKHAVMKYFGVDETKLENVESVQEVELNVADESLEREKERLLLENKWEYLRARKEAEHEAVMRQEILEELCRRSGGISDKHLQKDAGPVPELGRRASGATHTTRSDGRQSAPSEWIHLTQIACSPKSHR